MLGRGACPLLGHPYFPAVVRVYTFYVLLLEPVEYQFSNIKKRFQGGWRSQAVFETDGLGVDDSVANNGRNMHHAKVQESNLMIESNTYYLLIACLIEEVPLLACSVTL